MSRYEEIAAPAASFIQRFSSAEEGKTGTHFRDVILEDCFGEDEL